MKSARYKAEGVMNIWKAAEMGMSKAKKTHKKAIRKQTRVIEKRITEKEISNYV